MAIPNDIFEPLDSYDTSKDLWSELQKQLESSAKQLRNNRALCINEYFAFKAIENEALKDSYNKVNLLINKCKRFDVDRSSDYKNLKFLQSLNLEWMPLSMSFQTTLDLASWTLSDMYGSLISQQSQISQMKNQVGGLLDLVSKNSGEGSQKEKGKKKKALLVESEEEKEISKGEVDMKSMMITLALITKEYNRGFRRPSYRRQHEKEDRGKSYEKREEEKRDG